MAASESDVVRDRYRGVPAEAPAGLTVMRALEHNGMRLVTGSGCRAGFCGSCATAYSWVVREILRRPDGRPFRGECVGHGGHGAHGGLGGATGVADPSRRFAFGLMKNRLIPTPLEPSTPVTAGLICEVAERALGIA